MRTALFLVAGFLLLGGSLLLGRLFTATFAATGGFIALWLVIAGANMWLGVAKAGYSVSDELPIFLLIFAVPAAVAVVLKWKVV